MFPNVILMPFEIGVFLVRAIPDRDDPGRHVSKIDFYLHRHKLDQAAANMGVADLTEVATNIATTFSEVIRDEDYVMSSSQQTSANGAALDQIVFGRNEPALHHYHNTYRRMRGDEPLPLLSSIAE